MSDYAKQIATQLADQAIHDSLHTDPPADIDWRGVPIKAVHAGYGYGYSVRQYEVKP
jgi:hypothetical protein